MPPANNRVLMASLVALMAASCHPHYKGPVISVSTDECSAFGPIKHDSIAALVYRGASEQQLSCVIKKGNLLVPKPNKEIGLAYYYMADYEQDMDRRYALAKKGLMHGDWAVRDDENDGMANYVAAVNLGLVMQQDLMKAIGNVGRFKTVLEKAIEKIPTFDEAGAYRVLGQLYLNAPSWPASIGDPDMAVELFEKAVEIAPKNPINHLFLSSALWESEGKAARVEMREHYDLAMALFESESLWAPCKSQWRQVIEKIGKKLSDLEKCN